MAQVEQGALAGLALVGHDHLGLVGTGTPDDFNDTGRVARHDRGHVGFQPVEERRVAYQPVLDDFGHAGRELSRRQCVEHVDIGQHPARLVKRPDHVLAQRMIDAGLAAHGGVHLGQQGGGHLDEIDPALIDRGRKPGQVADHAATQRHDRGVAPTAIFQQPRGDDVQRGHGFRGLTVGQHQRVHLVRLGQCCHDTRLIKRGDRFVGHDQHVTPGNRPGIGGRGIDETAGDMDIVGSGIERHGQGGDVRTRHAIHSRCEVVPKSSAGRATPWRRMTTVAASLSCQPCLRRSMPTQARPRHNGRVAT